MTPNYTCEKCWCIVLEKFRRFHDAWHAHMDER